MFHPDMFTDDVISGAVGQSQHYGFRAIPRWDVERLSHAQLVDAFLLLADAKLDEQTEAIAEAEAKTEETEDRLEAALQEADEIEAALSRIAYALPEDAPQGLFTQLDDICERLRLLGAE